MNQKLLKFYLEIRFGLMDVPKIKKRIISIVLGTMIKFWIVLQYSLKKKEKLKWKWEEKDSSIWAG